MTLSRTAYLALGLINRGHRTGYEMKTAVERAARFFWTTSYGQLYPELRRLEAAGLVRKSIDQTTARGKKIYALTPDGEQELRSWAVANDEHYFELRSEGVLKLFLARDLGPETQLAIVEGIRADAERRRGDLAERRAGHAIERQVFAFGLRMCEATLSWCDDIEAAIRAGELEGEPV